MTAALLWCSARAAEGRDIEDHNSMGCTSDLIYLNKLVRKEPRRTGCASMPRMAAASLWCSARAADRKPGGYCALCSATSDGGCTISSWSAVSKRTSIGWSPCADSHSLFKGGCQCCAYTGGTRTAARSFHLVGLGSPTCAGYDLGLNIILHVDPCSILLRPLYPN